MYDSGAFFVAFLSIPFVSILPTKELSKLSLYLSITLFSSVKSKNSKDPSSNVFTFKFLSNMILSNTLFCLESVS